MDTNQTLSLCPSCKQEKDLSDGFRDSNQERVCTSCFELYYLYCENCEDVISRGDHYTVFNQVGSELSICEGCLENYTSCHHCGNYYHESIMRWDLGDFAFCRVCRDNGFGEFVEDNQPERQRPARPRLDEKTKKFQDTKKGDIIHEKRGFSAEIECYPPNQDSYYQAVTRINTELPGTGEITDRSLNSGGMEFQTPILRGAKGEKYIKTLSDIFVNNKFFVDVKAGLHIHLDGEGFTAKSLFTEEQILNRRVAYFFAINKPEKRYQNTLNSLRVYTRYGDILNTTLYPSGELKTVNDLNSAVYVGTPEEIAIAKQRDKDYLVIKSRSNPEFLAQEINSILSYLMSSLNRTEILSYEIYTRDFISSKLLPKLKQLFTVYYFADDFIMQILPHSRRNNKYCLPLWKEFNITEIDRLKSLSAFEKMWYQLDDLHQIISKKGDPKDVSRRHGANFHILMCRGHFELRYHSGTINADKILYWVQLNQALMKLADKDFEDFLLVRDELENIRFIQNLKLRRQRIYKLLKLPKDAMEYWEKRAKKFTDDNELDTPPEDQNGDY